MKKKVVCILVCTLLIAMALPAAGTINVNQNKLTKELTIVDEETSAALMDDGGLADKVKVEWYGPYLIEIIFMDRALHMDIINENGVTVEYYVYFNGTDRSGNILSYNHPQWGEIRFEDSFYSPFPQPPGMIGSLSYWAISDFRGAGLPFGFFDINVEITILNDGSSKKLIYHGMVFGISAIIFNPEGEVIDGSGNQNIQSSQQSSTSSSSQLLQLVKTTK